MTTRCRRQPRESVLVASRRIAVWTLALLLFAGFWWVIRPRVLYRLACANLGNYSCARLIDRAIRERHPQAIWQPVERGSQYHKGEPWYTTSFQTGRRACAAAGMNDGEGDGLDWLILDERLDRLGQVHTQTRPSMPPDDRDGEGALELVDWNWSRSSFPTQSATYTIFRLGSESHTLIAIVQENFGVTSAPVGSTSPIWTNNDRDNRHELEWVTYAAGTGGAPTCTSVFKLRWLGPGRMTYDGPLPPGFKVWLADEKNPVTFRPDESLDQVVRRVIAE